jgi:hypothetical protein
MNIQYFSYTVFWKELGTVFSPFMPTSESFTFISTLGSQRDWNSFYAAGLPASYLSSECLSSLQPAVTCIPALSLHSWFVIRVDGGTCAMGEQVTNFNTYHLCLFFPWPVIKTTCFPKEWGAVLFGDLVHAVSVLLMTNLSANYFRMLWSILWTLSIILLLLYEM